MVSCGARGKTSIICSDLAKHVFGPFVVDEPHLAAGAAAAALFWPKNVFVKSHFSTEKNIFVMSISSDRNGNTMASSFRRRQMKFKLKPSEQVFKTVEPKTAFALVPTASFT